MTDPIRIGILGAGSISDTHARAALAIPGVEIAAVYGRNADKSRRLAELYGGVAFDSLARFLDHRPMDVVAIGSPSALHAEQGIAAAERGLHVLVEKPIDVTAARGAALVAATETAGVKLGVLFQDRLKPDLVRLREFLHAGGLGRVLLASARVKWHRPPGYYSASRWRGTKALDGGAALVNQGIHTVDLLVWLLGPVARVKALTATRLHSIEGEDVALALLCFASGAVATLEATTAAFPGYPRRVEISGTEGTVIVEGDHLAAADLRSPVSGLVTAGDGGAASASTAVVSDAAPHRRMIEDFARAIVAGGPPACDGREGLRSLAVVEAVYASAGHEGVEVT
jgi:UDP-N-acetyl-2-amino-2-deoxyglucuronate dehydrogenase